MRTLWLTTLAVILLLALGVSSAHAADPVVTDARLETPDTLTVGDHFRYIIEIEADDGAELALAPNALPEALTLREAPDVQARSTGNGRSLYTMTLDLAAFGTGEIGVPPVPILHRINGGTPAEILAPPQPLFIQSVLPQSGEVTPRDLKPQSEIGVAPTGWFWPAVISVLVIALIVVPFFVWQKRRHRRHTFSDEAELADMGPEDRARARLDRAGAEFAAAHDYDAYYALVAQTMRSYLSERFEFQAFAMTTRELQNNMAAGGIDRWQARLVSGLLSQCDAVVYAKYRPAAERADADLTAAYEIVEMSRPASVARDEEPVPV